MPVTTAYPEKRRLSHDQYVSIMAFILSKNGFKAAGAPLTFAGAYKSNTKTVKGK